MFRYTGRSLIRARSWYTVSIPRWRASLTERSVTGSPSRWSWPASGWWNPVRILISVDLPAPLSPIRPSTSPRPSRIDTSRRATTGPKRLAMPSARMASSPSVTRTASSGCAAGWPPTLRIIEATMAMPRIMLNVKALMPLIVRPSRSMPRTRAPRKAPITVPEPPASAVPPMTAAATPRNIRSEPPASGSIESTRIASLMPAKPAKTAASMKLPTLIRLVCTPASRRRSGCRRWRRCARPSACWPGSRGRRS